MSLGTVSTRPCPSRPELSALIDAIKKGNIEAFSTFYDQTHRLVWALTLRILRDRDAAEEVTSDVYLQVWQKAGSYDENRGNPIAWLLIIARSRAVDRLRCRSRCGGFEPISVDSLRKLVNRDDPENITFLLERNGCIRAALTRLSSEQRQLIEIGFFEGLTHQEMAEKLGIPLGTIKTRMRCALIQLRQHLLPFAAV